MSASGSNLLSPERGGYCWVACVRIADINNNHLLIRYANVIRVPLVISAITYAKPCLLNGNHLFSVKRLVRRILAPKSGVFVCDKRHRIVE